MSGTTRITVASLAAQVAQHQAQTDSAIMGLTNLVERLVGVVSGQHNTPAAVVEITSAPSTRKAAKKAAAKTKAAPAPAKREMPTEVREGFAMVKATKDAISPLNKALAQVRKGQPWRKAHECTTEEINAALALVVSEHGKKVAKAALDALEARIQHAANRK
jgi:hypothetical protein